MSEEIATLGIKVDTSGVKKGADDLDKLSQAGNKAERSTDGVSSSFRSLAQAVSGLALGATIKEFIQSADAMDSMSARLKLVTDTQEQFANTQKKLIDLANQNRAGLQETVALFTKIADPVKRANGSMEDSIKIVDSFSKSLKIGGASAQEASAATYQFAQAMASGKLAGDEFRSIAEASPRFMKALADGMGVPREALKKLAEDGKLTIDVVGNALMKVGGQLTTEFAQLPTTVADAMVQIKNEVLVGVQELNNAGGFTQGIVAGIDEVKSAMPSFQAVLLEAAKGFEGLDNQSAFVEVALTTLRYTMETVLVVGANLAYMAQATGRELGGMAAQIAAIGRGDFAGAAAIGEAMRDDAALARKSIDDLERRILTAYDKQEVWRKDSTNSRADMYKHWLSQDAEFAAKSIAILKAYSGYSVEVQQAAMTSLANSMYSGKSSGGLKPPKATTDVSSVKKTADELAKVLDKINGKETGLDSSYWKDLETLHTAYSKGKLTLEKYADAVGKLTSQQKFNTDSNAAALKQQDDYVKALQAALGPLESKAQAIELEVANYGLTESAIQSNIVARMEEARAIAEANGAWPEHLAYLDQEIALRKQIASASSQKDFLDANKKAAEQSAKEWEKFSDEINRALTDALMRGFEDGKSFGQNFVDSLKNSLKTAALKIVVNVVTGTGGSLANGAINAVLGSSGSNNGGGTDYVGLANNASTAYSLYNNAGIAASWATGSMSTANAAGTVYANATGTGLDGLLATNGAYGTAAGESIGSSVAGYLGTALGSVGIVALVGALISSGMGSSNKYMTGSTLSGNYNSDGFSGGTSDEWTRYGGWARSDQLSHSGAPLDATYDEMRYSRNDSRYLAIAEQGENGFAGVSPDEQARVDSLIAQDQAQRKLFDTALDNLYTNVKDAVANNLGTAFEDTSFSEKLKGFAGSITPQQLIGADITAVFTNIGNELAAQMQSFLLPSVAAAQQAGETWSQAFGRLMVETEAVKGILRLTGSTLTETFGKDNMNGILAASDHFVRLFGSIDNLNSAFSSYYTAFYQPAEILNQAWKDMGVQFARMGRATPETISGFRDIVDSLDLATTSGQDMWSALIKISPAFAQLTKDTKDLNDATAKDLIGKFTLSLNGVSAGAGTASTAVGSLKGALVGTGGLEGGLTASQVKILALATGFSEAEVKAGALTKGVDNAGSGFGAITKLFMDAGSELLTFSDTVGSDGVFTAAQISALLLNDQIDDLAFAASHAVIDIDGLGKALADVDTSVFMTTMDLVFANLAALIQENIGRINGERVAVREAAIEILGPEVMSRWAIQAGINSISTSLPGNTDMQAARNKLNGAVVFESTALERLGTANAQMTDLHGQVATQQSYINSTTWHKTQAEKYISSLNAQLIDLSDNIPSEDRSNLIAQANSEIIRSSGMVAQYNKDIAGFNTTIGTISTAIAAHQLVVNKASADAEAATSSRVAADTAAKSAVVDYADAMQDFAIGASKSISKLSLLREETVKYYEAQKALADLMGNSASGLRTSIADYRYSQMTDKEQYNQLQSDFATAYAGASGASAIIKAQVAAGVDPTKQKEALSGYADQMNGLMLPMLEKAKEVLTDSAFKTFEKTSLSRAAGTASQLEGFSPKTYETDSLNLLSAIDDTLVALETSSLAAEQIISKAIEAGTEKTLVGLRAVVAAISGTPIPAFAAGGYHSGGLRLVGENGPELEVTGPSTIYSADQTRALFGGGGDMVGELRALRAEVANLRAEARATATHTAKIARQGDRAETDGVLVRTDSDTPLVMVSA